MLRYKTETRPGLVALYDQETERVNSYNPGARTEQLVPQNWPTPSSDVNILASIRMIRLKYEDKQTLQRCRKEVQRLCTTTL